MFSIRRACIRYNYINTFTRYSSTRSGLQDPNTKKLVEEIKQLEYKLNADIKKKDNVFEKISDEEIVNIYKELSAPTPTKPKISSDFLEKLKLRFLDTREKQILTSDKLELISDNQPKEGALEKATSKEATIEQTAEPKKYTLGDFEDLIYANSISKRPKEAQEAFDLIVKYGMTPSNRAFNHLMDAYANTNNVKMVISTFRQQKTLGLKPDIYTYAVIIKAFVVCDRLDDALVIFEKLKATSIVPSQPVFSSIISGCLKANKIEKAWEVFDLMKLSYHRPDEVSFTMMIHACAKRGEVEKALNLFEEMAGYQLYPTDVTFNVLIHACAKRADYYSEAFSLLEQMQENYGFKPDRITFNTLLTACARKKDLAQARHILNTMWEERYRDRSLAPDSKTFTNLFWCYASYHPQPSAIKVKETPGLVVKDGLLPKGLPRKRSDVVKEARALFKQVVCSRLDITSGMLNAYLTVHVSQKQTKECIDIYSKLYERHSVKKDGFTFLQMLEYCYKNKDEIFCWKVWEDYQTFLETRTTELESWVGEDQGAMMEGKAKRAKKEICAIKEGWTEREQRNLSILMANTLARVNDLGNALSILASEHRRSEDLGPLNLKELMPVYNKCVQLEQDDIKRDLIYICTRDKRRVGAMKYKRINT